MKIEDCEIITAKQYQARQETKYHNDCKKWEPEQGGFPQAAFYFFSDKNGNHRQAGYVLICGGSHFWRKTKRECVAIAKRETLELVPF